MTEQIHQVVRRSSQDQYSIWPADREFPVGWEEPGPQATKEECLAHIQQVWSKMRPRSVRKAPAADRGR